MHLSSLAFVLAVFGLGAVLAQPRRHSPRHLHKRDYAGVNWNDPALYKNVDWSKVNYGGGSPPPSPPANPPPVPDPASSPTPSLAPVVVKQDNVVQPPASSAAPQSNSPPPPPPPPPSTGSAGGQTTGGGKRGLAFNTSSPSLDIFNSYSEINWAHNWNSNPSNLPSKYLYVPTLFDADPTHTSQWDSDVSAAISKGGTTYLMSFNEPDIQAPQANMPVGAAVTAFGTYMTKHASDNVKIGSPSVSSGSGINHNTGQPMGLDWLRPFLEQCSSCPISFVPVHWYGCTHGCSLASDVDGFKTQMTAAMDAAVVNGKKLPVWVPEFQSFGDQEGFLAQVLPWLDGQAQIERYAYFMVVEGSLVQGGGLSALGKNFAG